MPDLSSLRLVKVPHAAPPYDCQIHGARCPAGEDVVAAPSPGEPDAEAAGLPALPGPVVATGPVTGPGPVIAAGPVTAAGPVVSRPRQLAVVIVEVLAGVRPDRQLVPMATDRVRARVRNLTPLLAADRRPTIARIVMSRPADRVAEVSVVVNFGARSRALAMRFEHVAARPAAPGWPARPARWLCTALEAG